MPMIFAQPPQVLIQGMTGKEGQLGLKHMTAAGTEVVAGVTPGKGGQDVDGVPVFNTVIEALRQFPGISATSIFVPPQFALQAATEAIQAKINTIHIFTEGIPTLDTAHMLALAEKNQVQILGPSSIGLIRPDQYKIGRIGGAKADCFLAATTENPGWAVLAKSGGMANTMASMLTQANIPQSLVCGIGGDRLIGSRYQDFLPELATDSLTKGVIIIGEIGGSYEEDLATAISETKFTKPVYAYISGIFAETLPQGVAFGHAGAIVSKTTGTRQAKITALEKAGAKSANSPTHIIELLTKE